MILPHLPTPWNIYNLRGSPFFQQALESGDTTPRPLSLFIGRSSELKRLLGTIHSAGANGSVQAIAGSPGVGKTTLVKELKAKALENGYFTTDSLVAILPGDGPEQLFSRVLGELYNTILANRPQSADNSAMADAKVLVRATRIATGGLSFGLPGVGNIGVTRGTTVVSPKDMMIDGPRIMRDLVNMVQGSDGRGVLLHLNNLENLSDADATHAAEVLRALRDVMLLHDGLHYIIVGTADAVNLTINTHPQIRSIVSTLALVPLHIDEVHALLQARYDYMRVNKKEPIILPVDDNAVAALYEFFRGDLRALLKALEDGVGPLIGLSDEPVRANTLDDLRPVLQRRYATELRAMADDARVEQLTLWGTADARAIHTQKSLGILWGITQGAVSGAVNYLTRGGYVHALPRTGNEPRRYELSGVSRLIFD